MIKLKVTGMTCGHCEAAVTKALAAIPNVERVVEVSREKQLAVVEGQADAQTLISAVTEAGYAAELAA
jgi:copper chaperone